LAAAKNREQDTRLARVVFEPPGYRPGSLVNLNRGSSHADWEDETSTQTGQEACTTFQTLRQALESGEARSTEEIPLPKTRGCNTQIR